MMPLHIGICICTCSLVLGIVTADVASDFIKAEIVPEILDNPPNQLISISYNGKNVNFGEKWMPNDVRITPTVEWKSDSSSYYTLIKTDLDPPSREKPKYREFVYWLVTNIPGSDISKGETIAEYVGAGPPKDGGTHRVMFLVYKQPGKLTFDEPYTENRKFGMRLWFSQKKFIQKYNLGDPIAGNMYTSEFDDYVPILHKEFMNNFK